MRRGLVLLALLLSLAPFVIGQYTTYSGYSHNNPVSATVSNMVWERMNARLVYRIGLKRKGFTDAQLNGLTTEQLKEAYLTGKISGQKAAEPPKEPSPDRPTPAEESPTRFRPTGERILLPKMIEGFTEDANHRKALTAFFDAAFGSFERQAKKEEMPNDIAMAMAFFTSAAFLLCDGEEPSDEAMAMLARAIRIGMEGPDVRKLSDLEKQTFYEFMVTMGSYLAMAAKEFVRPEDQALRDGLKNAAADVLKKFLKLDPAEIRMTKVGLEKREKKAGLGF